MSIITGLSVDTVCRFPMQTEFSRLLKIVPVNLNYRIGVHMNFAQSRIPALVCSLPPEYGCHQSRSYEGQRAMPQPIPVFSG